MKTVLNLTDIDPRTQPLFFGESLGLARYDRLKYPIFNQLAIQQEKSFWQTSEIDLSKDSLDRKMLSEDEKAIFDSNLRWQTATDAFLSRGIDELKQSCSNPELERCLNVWSFFELNIHSVAYSDILKNVYPDETVFWDSILSDQEIVKRMSEIKNAFDQLFDPEDSNIRKRIIGALVNVQIIEGIGFYNSFAFSFCFPALAGKMVGNGKILKLIEKDEAFHCSITSNLLSILKQNPEEGFSDFIVEADIIEAFKVATEHEIDWIDYLFDHGNRALLGITPNQFKGWVKFRANSRLKTLGIQPIYPVVKQNPLGQWYNEFVGNKEVQPAPQEQELIAYQIGQVNNSTDITDLGIDLG